MKKKKIAIIVASFPVISETFIINHIVEMIEQGHDVTIFSDKFNKSGLAHKDVEKYDLVSKTVYCQSFDNPFSRVIRILIESVKNIGNINILLKSFSRKFYGNYATKGYLFFEVLTFLKKEYRIFDIIHAHFGDIGNKVAVFREFGLLQGRFFCTFHGPDDIKGRKQLHTQDNYNALSKNCDALIFGSKYSLKQFESNLKIDIPKFINPVSVRMQKVKSKKDYTLTNSLILVTVGRLVNLKGQHLVIKAIESIHKKHPEINNIYYKVLGDGENMSKLRELTKQKSLEKYVKFSGSVSHEKVYQELIKSDVFVLFGITDELGDVDSQGVVVQEAQAVGLPVIVSDAGGLPEGLIDGKSGFVVKENSIEELAEKILYFYHNKDKIEEMGRNGVKFIEEKYSNEVVFNKLIKIYESII